MANRIVGADTITGALPAVVRNRILTDIRADILEEDSPVDTHIKDLIATLSCDGNLAVIQNKEVAFKAARIKATTLGNRSEVLPDVTVSALQGTDIAGGVSLGVATAVASSDVISFPTAHNLAVGDMIFFGTPSVTNNLTVGTAYYVRTVESTTAIKVATSIGGTVRDITADSTMPGAWKRQRAYQGSSVLNPLFRFLGATPVQASGSFPGSQYVSADSTDATYSPGTRIGPRLTAEVENDGSAIDVIVRNDGAGRGRILVDGREVKRYVSADFTGAGIAVDATGRFTLTFSSSKRRKITLQPDDSASWIFGFDVQPRSKTTYPTSAPKGPRVLCAFDSFGEGTGAAAGDPGMLAWLAWHMGWVDLWNSASGSTGWYAAGDRVSAVTRYVNDFIDTNPDILIFALGINDMTAWNTNPANVQTAFETVIDGVRTAKPNAEIIVVGPWPNNGGVGVVASLIAMDAWFQAECAERTIQFVSPIQDGLVFGTSDGVHPNSAGHALLGAWLAARISLPYTR